MAHFDAAPQYLNPALTGMYFGEKLDYRFNVNYAAQTLGMISNVYNTAAVGYDMHIKKFGLGGYIINSRAGESNYNVFNCLLSGAYEISIDPTYRHNLVTGVQFGLFSSSFNQEKLYFESQYSTSDAGFDQSLINGEQFEKTNLMNLDAGLGSFYEYRNRHVPFNPFIGFSIFHATAAKSSFFKNQDSKYPYRFSLYTGMGFNLNEVFQLSPRLLFMQQANNQLFDIGIFNYYNPGGYTKPGFIVGALYNSNDNITIHTGIRMRSNIYRISYGFSAGIQKKFTGSRNDFEISVIMSRKTNSSPSYN